MDVPPLHSWVKRRVAHWRVLLVIATIAVPLLAGKAKPALSTTRRAWRKRSLPRGDVAGAIDRHLDLGVAAHRTTVPQAVGALGEALDIPVAVHLDATLCGPGRTGRRRRRRIGHVLARGRAGRAARAHVAVHLRAVRAGIAVRGHGVAHRHATAGRLSGCGVTGVHG